MALYPLMFPDEELRPVVSELLNGGAQVLSLVACQAQQPIAHVVFSLFGSKDEAGALLAPLGVRPDFQGQGVGSKLVSEGLERLADGGVRQVFVLGDPNYYGRFGFAQERQIPPPYPLPAEWAEAWQSLVIAGREPLEPEPLGLPDTWMKPELWGP